MCCMMEIITKYSAGILFVGLCIWQVNGASFQPSPSTIIIGGQNPTTSLNMTCAPNYPGMTGVFNIDIGRITQSGSQSPIIQITNTVPVTVVDTSYTQRVSTSGSISGSTGSVMMSLRDLRCDDAASYYCTATVNTGSGVRSDEGTFNVTAQTNPGTIVMTPTPVRDSLYYVGETVTFSCSGPIGNREGSMETLWNWQTRDIAGVNSSWITYPNTHNNITYEPKQPSGACQYTARSILTHVVKMTDNGRDFRCFFSNAMYQANFTLYTERTDTTPGFETTGTTTPTSDRVTVCVPDKEMSFGSGIAIGIGLMLVLDILCLIGVFMFRRKVGACLTGTNSKEVGGSKDMRFHTIPPTGSGGLHQQNVSDAVYEEPELRNEYAELQTETRVETTPATYDKIKNYQNA